MTELEILDELDRAAKSQEARDYIAVLRTAATVLWIKRLGDGVWVVSMPGHGWRRYTPKQGGMEQLCMLLRASGRLLTPEGLGEPNASARAIWDRVDRTVKELQDESPCFNFLTTRIEREGNGIRYRKDGRCPRLIIV